MMEPKNIKIKYCRSKDDFVGTKGAMITIYIQRGKRDENANKS